MARRSALPDGAGTIPPETGKRCGPCAADNPPRYLCPTCPRRATQKSDDDHGWAYARQAYANDLAMLETLRCDAEIARSIAITKDDHPAMPLLLASYADQAERLGRMRAARRPR